MTTLNEVDSYMGHISRMENEAAYEGKHKCQWCDDYITGASFYRVEGDKICKWCFEDYLKRLPDEAETPIEEYEEW